MVANIEAASSASLSSYWRLLLMTMMMTMTSLQAAAVAAAPPGVSVATPKPLKLLRRPEVR